LHFNDENDKTRQSIRRLPCCIFVSPISPRPTWFPSAKHATNARKYADDARNVTAKTHRDGPGNLVNQSAWDFKVI